MGLPLKSLSKQVVALAFNMASDLVISAQYAQPGEPNYDTATGVASPVFSILPIEPMVLAYSLKEVDGTVVRVGDERLLVKSSEMGNLSPSPDDLIVDIVAGIARRIVGFRFDATRQIFDFHCRTEAGIPAAPIPLQVSDGSLQPLTSSTGDAKGLPFKDQTTGKASYVTISDDEIQVNQTTDSPPTPATPATQNANVQQQPQIDNTGLIVKWPMTQTDGTTVFLSINDGQLVISTT